MPDVNPVNPSSQLNLNCATTNEVSGQCIAQSALNIIAHSGRSYAFSEAPSSPYKNLSGNKVPNQTQIAWLKNKNKCNQFVGDVLSAAGFGVPTNRMADGTEHYKIAESFPNESAYFLKLDSTADVQVGDVFVKDYGADDGECGGHTEVVVEVDRRRNVIKLAGAHRNGAYVSEMSLNNESWKFNPLQKSWTNGLDNIYFLRARKKA